MRSSNVRLVYFACILLTACGTQPIKPSDKHIQREQGGDTNQAANIPQPVKRTIPLPPPAATPKAETYSVVVTNVPAQEILFALARDAKINLDIHAGIQGTVTLNAINQTLPQILNRIAKLVDMSYELDNGTLTVMPDKQVLKTYKIDFINMSRAVDSTMATSTQIAGAATTTVTTKTKNDLMESLISNVSDMLKEEDRIIVRASGELSIENNASTAGSGQISTGITSGKKNINRDGTTDTSGPGGSVSGSGNQSAQSQSKITEKLGYLKEAVYVFANKESGVLFVRATSRQHEKVQEFIDTVVNTAKRQVLIEATIVEVRLSDNYKQGIDWSRALLGANGFALSQTGTAGIAGTTGALSIGYINTTSRFGNIAASVQLLETFGNVKVLSSPKLTVMNNQTATLKVVDNRVYFTVKADTQPCSPAPCQAITTYTTAPISVAVGFVMNVTPQINDADTVTINVRPTITRILDYVNDPSPTLKTAGVVNPVPEIQTREMESIVKINSGQTAVMGGLMQDEINNLTDAIPGVSNIPLLGNLFKNRNDTTTKTELVIFLRPVVIKDASMNGDYSAFRDSLPDADFFKPKSNADFFKPTLNKSPSSSKP